MPRLHSSSGEDPAVHEAITIYGKIQEQKWADDLGQARKLKV